jgi:hypothetical protein
MNPIVVPVMGALTTSHTRRAQENCSCLRQRSIDPPVPPLLLRQAYIDPCCTFTAMLAALWYLWFIYCLFVSNLMVEWLMASKLGRIWKKTIV